MREEQATFNWKLLLYGAIGFGIGFAITGAIMTTIYNVAENAMAFMYPGTSVNLAYPVYRGLLVGGLGGAGLGLACKDKKQVLYFSLAGAMAFALAFTFVISLIPNYVPEVGRSIMRLFGGPEFLSDLETSLSHGLGMGVFIGGIGGAGIGLASSKSRLINALLLCVTGTFWFGNAFAFGASIYDGNFYSSWNWMAGAIGGAIFGSILAASRLIIAKKQAKMPAPPVAG